MTNGRQAINPRKRGQRTAALSLRPSRKEFLLQFAGVATASTAQADDVRRGPKVLIVVAHPDDEYTFAATVYRMTKELGGIVDQLILTNGEGGYRYSRLAEAYYGLALTREEVGRAHLPEIRKQETLRAGRITWHSPALVS